MLRAVVAIMLAAPAAAQTTDCAASLGGVRCKTTSPSTFSVDDFVASVTNPQAASAGSFAAGVEQGERLSRAQAAREVGGLIVQCQCGAAVDLALRRGQLDLAERAKRICE